MKVFKNKCWRWGLLLASNFLLLQAGSARAVPEVLVLPSPFKGLNGLSFDAAGQLYVGSVAEQTVYRVDVATGEYEIFLNPPKVRLMISSLRQVVKFSIQLYSVARSEPSTPRQVI